MCELLRIENNGPAQHKLRDASGTARVRGLKGLLATGRSRAPVLLVHSGSLGQRRAGLAACGIAPAPEGAVPPAGAPESRTAPLAPLLASAYCRSRRTGARQPPDSGPAGPSRCPARAAAAAASDRWRGKTRSRRGELPGDSDGQGGDPGAPSRPVTTRPQPRQRPDVRSAQRVGGVRGGIQDGCGWVGVGA